MNIADMQLTIAGLREGLEIEREENQRLREGLMLAREWLDGWGSAESYIAKIDAILAPFPIVAQSPDQPNAEPR